MPQWQPFTHVTNVFPKKYLLDKGLVEDGRLGGRAFAPLSICPGLESRIILATILYGELLFHWTGHNGSPIFGDHSGPILLIL